MRNTGALQITTLGDREIVMTRSFNAPRRLVWDAYTKPELVRQWLGVSGGWTFAVCEMDLRVGGKYRWVWQSPDGYRMGMGGEYREIEKPELLMLGMLLHDIGKAKGHGHVAKGIPLIRQLTARLGLSPTDAGLVELLVAHHLTMSHVAQRRDIDDPKTIESFAATVATPERLRMLYLLTWADMRAVGPGVLTGWQAAILHELYARTLARLTGGRVARPTRAQVAERLHEILRDDVGLQAATAHLAMMPDRYLAGTPVQRMAAHVRLVQQLEAARAEAR